jgi:hypothetical protein
MEPRTVVEPNFSADATTTTTRKSHPLSDNFGRSVCPNGKNDFIFYHDQTTGFALRVTSKGERTWQAAFRVHGVKQRLKLGQFPTMSSKVAPRPRAEGHQPGRRRREPG